MQSQVEIIVRSTEIDVNGHVNNAKYLEYLEWGREKWYEDAQLAYATFQNMGIHTVVVSIHINYRQECKQGDCLTVTCAPQSIGKSSYVFIQKILNQRKEMCVEATVSSVTVHTASRKSCEAPIELRKHFSTDTQTSSKIE